VNVVYAASLLTAMGQTIGPHVRRMTGFTMAGHSGASGAFARELVERVRAGLAASYTPTVLDGAAHRREAIAFAAFFLGEEGRSLPAQHGLHLVAPRVIGDTSAVRAPIAEVLRLR
jgi:ABC-type molybdate transport system substrate-binding protein